MRLLPALLLGTLIGGLAAAGAAAAATPERVLGLYRQHCAECHHEQRLGGMGPALLPGNLKRLRRQAAVEVIGHGRAATQMPAFADKLAAADIEALADYIYTPPAKPPVWGLSEIRASHIIHNREETLSPRPVYPVDDPLNLFLVVELGDHHVTLLDGDRLEPIHRFKTRFALHGGPKYAANGRFVYFASRDGWISKYDIYNLKWVAEIRAGINTRNLAVSADGRYVMVANYLPHSLVLLDARDLSPIRLYEVKDASGRSSRVSAVYTAPPRQSFIAALKDLPEVWEISYAEEPPAGFSGWVHDYRSDSGENLEPEPFPVRRIRVKDYLDDFFFDQEYVSLIGASREGKGQVVDLDLGRVVAELDLPGMPHLGSGITWTYQGRPVLATPNLKKAAVSVIDMQTWKTIKTIKTLGPGFFMRSHEQTPYAWVDVFFGPNRDAVHVIDKRSLEIVKTLRPAPGKTAAHVEFTRDGRYALLSIWDPDGAVVVYDAASLQEVKRLPMNKPSGKYNVYNKTRYSAGTSH
ncbi:cytochrome D1 domain-containing protein [Thiohalobacter sp. IOR34]|uniref:nitrite reductase n=1 Tax=Thiohalobacter sp. IOR34 TaxID=3057176 RepID=UPI0025AF841B|nr:nitrite reductase [Thiohalobacter sp. IOR34]WJW75439.1 cytochrome D1 domain-containing protein [Thiohalobacter sp. IOR34]